MFLAIDRVSKFTYIEFHGCAGKMEGAAFLQNVVEVFRPGKHQGLRPDLGNRLKLKSDHSARQIAFACEDDGGSLIEFGKQDLMTRVFVDETAPLEPFVGRYSSAMLGAFAEVTEDEGGRHLILSGRFGSAAYELIAVSCTIWSARPHGVWPALGAMVTFVDGGRGLRFAADAIRPVLFTRTN